MGTVIGLTAERMLEIEKSSIVRAVIDANNNLILTTRDGTQYNAGSVGVTDHHNHVIGDVEGLTQDLESATAAANAAGSAAAVLEEHILEFEETKFTPIATAWENFYGTGAEIDNLNTLNGAIEAAKEAAKTAAIVKIESTKGVLFKNNTIATDLNVVIYYGSHVIRDYDALVQHLGQTSYLEWFWRREEDTEFGVISGADSRLTRYGFTLTVSPDDVDEKTVFQCILHD